MKLPAESNAGAWEEIWGVTDPQEQLSRLGVVGELEPTGDSIALRQDRNDHFPIYTAKTVKGVAKVIMSEISNGLYVIGIKR